MYIYGFRNFSSSRSRLSPRSILTTNRAGLPVAPGFYFEREKEKERARERKSEREAERERETGRYREREGEREREGGSSRQITDVFSSGHAIA